jgi:hypothetical protein
MGSTVVASKRQVSVELHGEIVILELDSGVYYGLTHVGRSIWSRLAQPTSVAALCLSLMEEYEVELEQCRLETLAFLNQMASYGLVEIVHENTAESPTSPGV